jgi:hypothetical protein
VLTKQKEESMSSNKKENKILIDFEKSFKVKGLGSLTIKEIDSLFDEDEFAAYADAAAFEESK